MRSKIQLIETTDDSGPDLITLADLKLELDITDTADDEVMQNRITRQSKLIAEACNRVFALTYAVETFTFDYGERLSARQGLNLSFYPIVSIESVTEDGVLVTDFDFDPEKGQLWRTGPLGSSSWCSWPGNYFGGSTIAVTYSGGYELPDDAPASLQAACIQAVSDAAVWASTGLNQAVQRVAHGDSDVRYFEPSAVQTGLSGSVMDLIRPFRRPGMA